MQRVFRLTDRRLGSAALVASLTAACSGEDAVTQTVPAGGSCSEALSPAALVKAGTDGTATILPGGRRLTPAGRQFALGGFPVDVRVHPSLPVAYVMNTGYSHRAVQVVDTSSGAILQDIVRPDTFYGMALSPDATKLYAAGGYAGTVDLWDIGADGQLTAASQIPVPQVAGADPPYPAGIAVAPDGKTLWVGEFLGLQIDEIDLASATITASIPLQTRAYSLLDVPATGQLWVTGFGDSKLTVLDLASRTVVDTLDVGPKRQNPNGLALSKDGSRVFVSVSDGDVVLAYDATTRQLLATGTVGEPNIKGPDGTPLPASSPSGLTLDPSGDRLLVVRAADNAVSFLDPMTLETKAAIPVGWYPTSVGVTGTNLVVLNGKGYGTGPLDAQESGKEKMNGSLSLVDLGGADLPALTKQVEDNVKRPSTFFPNDCPKGFSIPTRAGEKSPIEHIVLIVRENKTYDSELGDLDGADGDPSLVLYGNDVTPNLHAMARQFTHHDNFYDDSETSTQGHLWLTSSFVNDYIERTWLEDYRNHPGYSADPGLPRGAPAYGSFFTHLIANSIDFTDYGEVTGALAEGVTPHVDTQFPGAFFNTDVKDEEKANYVGKRLVDDGMFPPFVYVLLPNDHTNGTGAGKLTPEAMISDNDYASGLLVDKISHSSYWKSTAIFLVEDDPQIGADHVEYHRSYLVVMSPWAKHGHVSHVHTSFPSLFRTFELILGVPPMNRYDALAPALFDAFTSTPDNAPFDVVQRTVPDTMNAQSAPGSAYSDLMDFRGPDRNPDLGAVLWWERRGAPPAGSRIAAEVARGAPPSVPTTDADDVRGMAAEAAGWRWLEQYAAEHPEIRPDIRPGPSAPLRRAAQIDAD